MIIDTHCHFDMMKSPESYIQEIENKGDIVIGMTNMPSHFKMGVPFVKKYKHIRLALGLHPLLASEQDNELELFKRLLPQTSYIGEVGLDFSRDGYSIKEKQIKNFEYVLQCIVNKNKLLSIHSKRAEETVLELLKKYHISNAIFHWYSGNLSTLNKILECNYYFSLNEAMIESSNGKKLISYMPLNRILTETDAPFNKKCNINNVIAYLAKEHNLSIVEIESTIKTNFYSLINNVQ
ncbi:TatD family hydrolase [Parabacteroides gordonii]|uniref:TatD family hydrolase n=1 Tax=Parabacteroides gordonii MS-1 = DSM 23371 TaxID=1203610 RepID=A0A0F5IWC8_9BACT|nr:TatD family hydrolase [Parabacteroides gordonii]KKB49447.1 TatD family hydrolase [Parabacteroides gordonii MS-1 = DSM 23371]MCA5585716.1 TatD family hydrolase [Parabacteroides gordonii]